MLSASGSIVNRISSFTDTTGFMIGAAGWAAGGGVDDRDEEHALRLAITNTATPNRWHLDICRAGLQACGILIRAVFTRDESFSVSVHARTTSPFASASLGKR